MELNIERIVLLLLIAATVSMIGRKLRLPYTVGLVIAGVGIAVLPLPLHIVLTKELIFTAFLPPLIYEAALQIRWRELRTDFLVVIVLATLGVLVSAAVTCAGMHWLIGWSWDAAMILGVLLSATDPVSVIATFKDSRVVGRLRLLVEAESLFNDGTAAVLFAVAIAAIGGGDAGARQIASSFIIAVLGGIVVGAIVGAAAMLLAGRTNDPLVEITFTLVAAYGTFLLAQHFHCSGVLATLTAGIIMGNAGALGSIADKSRADVILFWEYIAFVANSLIFLIIGMQMAHYGFARAIVPIGAAIALSVIGRGLAVYGCCGLFLASERRVSAAHQHILVWGGLRGALALALVLGLPDALHNRETLISVTFAVVAFSVIVQGLTIPHMLSRLGQTGSHATTA